MGWVAAEKELFAYCQAVVLMGKEIEGDLRPVGNQIGFWDESGARTHVHLLFDVFGTKMTAERDVVEQRSWYARLQDFQNFPEALHHQSMIFIRKHNRELKELPFSQTH